MGISIDRVRIEVESRIFIPFDWLDPTPGGSNLGRAEFQVCCKFNGGSRRKSFELWVDPVQTRLTEWWHYPKGDRTFTIQAYEGLDKPDVWMVGWCPEHKTNFMRIYTPTDTKYLLIDQFGLKFTKTVW